MSSSMASKLYWYVRHSGNVTVTHRSVVPIVTRIPLGRNFTECSTKFCTMRGAVYGPSKAKPPLGKARCMVSLNARSISSKASKTSGSSMAVGPFSSWITRPFMSRMIGRTMATPCDLGASCRPATVHARWTRLRCASSASPSPAQARLARQRSCLLSRRLRRPNCA